MTTSAAGAGRCFLQPKGGGNWLSYVEGKRLREKEAHPTTTNYTIIVPVRAEGCGQEEG
jgi:hypothetical protein